MQPSSSSTLRSRRLEVMGAGKNKAHDRDTHACLPCAPHYLLHPLLPSMLLFLFLWGEVLRDNTKNGFPEFICKCTKPAQRQLLLRTTSKRRVGTVFNYKTTYHTLSSSASSSPVRSSSSLSLSSDGSSTTTQNEYFKI